MKKKIILLLVSIGLVSGCQSQPTNYVSNNQSSQPSEMAKTQQDSSLEKGRSTKEESALIQTGTLNLETKDYKNSKNMLLDWVKSEGFKLQYQDEHQSSYYGSNAQEQTGLKTFNLTIRVSQDKFETVMNQLNQKEKFGKLVSSTQGAQDVTKETKDIKLRVESLDKRIDRLNQLLDQAKNMQEIITIQNSLDEAILQRDQLISEQETLKDQVEYATLTISLQEISPTGNDAASTSDFGERLKEAFANIGVQFIWLVQSLILGLVYAIPYLLILGIIVLLASLLLRKKITSLRLKKNKGTNSSEKEMK